LITTTDILQAYFDCRKNKRRTASATVYEMDYESRLIGLRDRINARTYTPGKSICFVVTRPRYREVFAASFEDRIVHHYIAQKLEPLFEQIFNPRTYNCRKGKGQLYGVDLLKKDIQECSENYKKDCYILKLDLKGFFMSIYRVMLADMVDAFIAEYYQAPDKEDLRYVCRVVILHEPEFNCERHSPANFWDRLPANKSLFTNGRGYGVAIGNLFAQLFANFLLNVLDWFLEELGIKYHGRYVDDFYMIHTDRNLLLAAIPKIRAKLAEYHLRINEKKFYLQHYRKGVEFTGAVVKPHRAYACNRSINNFAGAVAKLNRAKNIEEIEKAVSSVNSYIGLLRHYHEYKTRRRIVNRIKPGIMEYLDIKGDYRSIVVKKQYRPRAQTLERIRNGDY
jgi:RNA-directed DNA polymerase